MENCLRLNVKDEMLGVGNLGGCLKGLRKNFTGVNMERYLVRILTIQWEDC